MSKEFKISEKDIQKLQKMFGKILVTTNECEYGTIRKAISLKFKVARLCEWKNGKAILEIRFESVG
jgi:G:T-mismatch repair DNA endonuclease (very short patch repair protein)